MGKTAKTEPKKIKIIFIAGASYSGSTVLSLMLGGQKTIFAAGELDKCYEVNSGFFKSDRQKEIKVLCSCGQPFLACPFWGPILKKTKPNIDFNPAPGFSRKNFALALKILFWPAKRLIRSQSRGRAYARYINIVYGQARQTKKTTIFLLDSSKSLNTLFYYLSQPHQFDLRLIHIIKRGALTADSFKKHGYNFFTGLAGWLLVNFFIIILKRKASLNYKKVSYRQLATEAEKTMAEIARWLNQAWPPFQIEQITKENYHYLGGNPLLNKFKQGGTLKKIKYCQTISHLNKIEKNIAKIISWPFDFLFKA